MNLYQTTRKSQLDPGQVRRYWYNVTSEVNLRSLAILARTLGVQPGDLVAFSDDNEPALLEAQPSDMVGGTMAHHHGVIDSS